MTVKRLGKGLSALIPQDQEEPTLLQRITEIPIDKIRPNPYQPRKEVSQDNLDELVESIRENGVLQPITVRKANGFYQIIAGERRWRACKSLQMKTIPAYILHVDTDEEMMLLALIENIQREDLNPLDQAVSFKTLMERFGLSQEELGHRLGKNRSTIANTIRLLKLPLEVQKALKENKISAGHARALLALENNDLILNTCEQIINEQLSVRQTEELVKNLLNTSPARETPRKSHSEKTIKSPHLRVIEEKLMTLLGTKVRLKTRNEGQSGQITIQFYSPEELEHLLELFQLLEEKNQ